MPIKLNSTGGGSVSIDVPSTASTYTLTVPAASATLFSSADGVLVPAGSIIFHAVNTAPTGFVKANGAALSRTTYATLFAAIGTTFGVGNGSTTFNVPDLRGYFPRGWNDDGSQDSGRAFGSTQTDAFQGHYHTLVNPSAIWHNYGSSALSGGGQSGAYDMAVTSPTSDGTNGTPRTASETRPKNVALLACIKY